jgi:hypothetical protein
LTKNAPLFENQLTIAHIATEQSTLKESQGCLLWVSRKLNFILLIERRSVVQNACHAENFEILNLL